MKILQVSPYFYPYVGGQERYVRSLGRALVERGHSVDVVTSNFPRTKELEVIDGMLVRRFGFFSRPLNNPLSPKLFVYLRKHYGDFDIIHCHNEHAAVTFYCSLASSQWNGPFVVTCHGQLRFDSIPKDTIERMYSKTFASFLLRKAARIMTISGSDRSYIASLRIPREKIEVIPNGVELANYDLGHCECPAEFSFDGKQVVLFVGPILKRKGPHVLIQAIPSIVKQKKDVVFVFAGRGSFKEEAQELSKELDLENYAYFTGYVSEEKLRHLYRRSDIFCLPSFSEALSYTILDALAFSKPVISTSIPCITDYLAGTALLVQPGNPEELADALLSLLTNRKLRRDLGLKGRRLVESQFRWESVVDRILETYHKALNNASCACLMKTAEC